MLAVAQPSECIALGRIAALRIAIARGCSEVEHGSHREYRLLAELGRRLVDDEIILATLA